MNAIFFKRDPRKVLKSEPALRITFQGLFACLFPYGYVHRSCHVQGEWRLWTLFPDKRERKMCRELQAAMPQHSSAMRSGPARDPGQQPETAMPGPARRQMPSRTAGPVPSRRGREIDSSIRLRWDVGQCVASSKR